MDEPGLPHVSLLFVSRE